MSRTDYVFGSNWVEQWRSNFEDNAFDKCEDMSVLECAEEYGVDVFDWSESPEGDGVWSDRDDDIGHEEEW